MTAKWYFKQQQPGDITRDPVVGEFFSTDAIDNPAESLVREGIQNALDARRESESQVHVRIFLSHGDKFISPKWIGNAWLHFKAKGNGLQNVPLETQACPYLVFEDFGTTGLYGDEKQPFDIPDKKNPFFYFFRAEGRSGKSGEDRGRWGVGKHVFPRSSLISTYFGFTVRSTDGKSMLMGHTILKSHKLANTNFTPDGYFGVQQLDHLMLPFADEQILEEFSRDFNLSRVFEPGLSIVVPHVDPEITFERIKQAVVTGYFLPILENKLLVTIENEKQKIEVSQATIMQESIGLTDDKGNDFFAVLKFADWCVTKASENLYILNACSEVPPSWTDELIPKNLKRTMRADLDSGKNMAVRMPLKVETEDGLVNSHFYVYIGSDHSKSTRPVFIREGITISNVRTTRMPGIRALVVVDHKPLASLLGDSENPAHTEWQKGSKFFTSRHPSGRRYIDFVSNSVSKLVNALSAEEGEKDPYLFADIFSLPLLGDGRNDQPDTKDKLDKDPDRVNKKPKPKTHPKPSLFTVAKTKNGFKVTPNAVFGDLPFTFKILTAYNVRRGNPFKKYNSVDFQIKDSMITNKGLQVVKVDGNKILLNATSLDFEIEVNGFDTKRDLIVKPDVVKGGEDD